MYSIHLTINPGMMCTVKQILVHSTYINYLWRLSNNKIHYCLTLNHQSTASSKDVHHPDYM